MNRIAAVASFRLLALAFWVGTLAACGVKGELEPPPGAASAAPVASSPPAAGGKLLTERSEVRRTPSLSVNPPQPKEWDTDGAERSKKSQSESARDKPLPSDQPFILDGLL